MKYGFSLFAPHIKRVAVVGSWSKKAVPMKRDDSGMWHGTAELADGRHTYRFRLPSLSPFLDGKTVEVTDPRARMVDELEGDVSVIVIADGRDVTTEPDFEWQHDGVPLAQNHELVIYELHVAEFGWNGSSPGTFTSVIDRLDYLQELGVNAVELMPVTAFPGDESWGYNVRHAFAMEHAYGDPGDFKRLVDACHGHGIRVIIDLVLNHSESEAPLTKIDFHYWYRDDRDDEMSFGPKFDYERFDEAFDVMPARRFAHEVAAFWVQEYHVDGYRLDATAILDNFDVVREIRDIGHQHAAYKPFYVVAEQLPEDPAIAGPDAPADGAWHQGFLRPVFGWLTGEKTASAAAVLAGCDPANSGYVAPELVVNYLESHDEQSLLGEMGARGITGEGAFRRHKLGAALLFTAVGVPMLYQGQEFGSHRERDMEIRTLQWDLLEHDYGLHLKAHYAFLIEMRHGSPALTGADFEPLHLDEKAGVIAYRRGTGEAEVIVVASLRDDDRDVSVPFADGAWRELTEGHDLDIQDGTLSEAFPGCTARIYVRG